MRLIPIFCIFLAYFAFGWTSTTDILRLCKGCNTPVLKFTCYCDACGGIVPMKNQIPYYSYFHNHGKCNLCGAKIPIGNVLLEAIVFLPMFLITALFSFRVVGVLCSFAYYEMLKCGFLVKKGIREQQFIRQLLLSLGMNLFCCLMACMIAAIVGVC